MSQLGKQLLDPLAWVNYQVCVLGDWGQENGKDTGWACRRRADAHRAAFGKDHSHRALRSILCSAGDGGWPSIVPWGLHGPQCWPLEGWALESSGGKTLWNSWKAWTEEMASAGSINVGHKGGWSRKERAWQGSRVCGMLWVHIEHCLGWNFWVWLWGAPGSLTSLRWGNLGSCYCYDS